MLSNHPPVKEYLGEKLEPSWNENPVIKVASDSLVVVLSGFSP